MEITAQITVKSPAGKPALMYLETKFATLVSFGLTGQLLEEVLPIGQALSVTAIRNRVKHTAQRLESELGPAPDASRLDGDPPSANAPADCG